MITYDLDTPNGPRIEYGPEDDFADVEAAAPPGWIVDWDTNAYRLADGRLRSPLVLEGSTLEARIDAALYGAEDAFWAVIANAFPEATTGDFDPGESAVWDDAMKRAVRAWVTANVHGPGGMPEGPAR